VALALPLAFEVKEPDIMRRPPRPPDAPLFSGFVVFRVVAVSLLMTGGAIALFTMAYQQGGDNLALARAQTMVVTFVIMFQIFYLIHCRSLKDSILKIGFFSNPTVFWGIGVILGLQALFVYLPIMQRVFRTAPLSGWDIALTIAAGFLIFPAISLEKIVRSLLRRGREGG
jgi:Ca2+-transporting ATPase